MSRNFFMTKTEINLRLARDEKFSFYFILGKSKLKISGIFLIKNENFVSKIHEKWLSGNDATSAELALSWNFAHWIFSKLMTSRKRRVLNIPNVTIKDI
jgi:hypothetical protein